MRIYESEDDGVIGEFLYQTVEFTQKEFADKGIRVISQTAVKQHLTEERPDLKVKKLGSFRFNSQENTVSVRIGTLVQKLLGPGYDELMLSQNKLVDEVAESEKQLLAIQEKHAALIEAVSKDAQKFSDLLVENEELKEENKTLDRAVAGYVRAKLTEKADIELSSEDAADLADVKKVMGGGNMKPLPEFEGTITASDGTEEEIQNE